MCLIVPFVCLLTRNARTRHFPRPAVAQHYGARANQSVWERKHSPIYALRVLNNWVSRLKGCCVPCAGCGHARWSFHRGDSHVSHNLYSSLLEQIKTIQIRAHVKPGDFALVRCACSRLAAPAVLLCSLQLFGPGGDEAVRSCRAGWWSVFLKTSRLSSDNAAHLTFFGLLRPFAQDLACGKGGDLPKWHDAQLGGC